MAERRRRSSLEGHYSPGEHGATREGGPGLTLRERQPASIAQINGAPPPAALEKALAGFALSSSLRTNHAAHGKGAAFLGIGPGMWLVVSERSPEQLRAALGEALAGSDATVTELSHARTVVRIDGANTRDLLMKVCPLDVERMETGACATTALGQLSVLVHCTGDESFELYVLRSFGRSLWEMMGAEAAEFGYRIEPRA